MNMFLLYLALQADSVLAALNFVNIGIGAVTATIVVICVCAFGVAAENSDDSAQAFSKRMGKIALRMLAILFVGVLLASAIPSTKTCLILVGVDYAQSNEQLMKLPDNTLRLLNAAIEKQIDKIEQVESGDVDDKK